ncbi:MAG: hypothetical protein K2K55_06450 [Duncaniella sp.]|nr:hypothetical protein [Duncaniella sp.]
MKKFILSLLAALFCFAADAQLPDITQEIYKERVALMDEFMQRFNSRDSISETSDSLTRQQSIVTILRLFNLSNFSSPEDPMLTAATEFASAAVDSCVFISYPDSAWTAFATCHGIYRKQPVTFVLELKVARRGPDMYKWVISGVEGELFSLPPIDTGKGFYIFPDSHETNFMALSDLTDSHTESIRLYADPSVTIDPLSAFFAMVYGGQLKIDHVKPLEFRFRQVPGWEFTVRQFERDNLNSGWLIDAIEKL